MKPARIVVLVIALGAGGAAAMLASKSGHKPQAPALAQKIETAEVLVAKKDIGIGEAVNASKLSWQRWPASTVGTTFIRKSAMPNAFNRLNGAIARYPFAKGEPIIQAKLVTLHGSGFMAAILPSGMRAYSTSISVENSAGGFILPNDRVDVILTRRDKDDKGEKGDYVATTVLTNVKVLAIDQMLADKDGKKVAIGRTATLELTPKQAETLALSRQQGTLSLALRSIADTNRSTVGDGGTAARDRINTIRFGVSRTTSIK